MSAVIYGLDAYHRAVARRAAKRRAASVAEAEWKRAQDRYRNSLDRITGPVGPDFGGAA